MKPGSSLVDRADGLQSDIGPAHSVFEGSQRVVMQADTSLYLMLQSSKTRL
jgi:hypothetical protein